MRGEIEVIATKMLHAESEGVRSHHQISSSSAHQTSSTSLSAQKTPFAIQELLGLTNTNEHEPMNTAAIKQQIQNGESNNPFSYYNHKAGFC